MEEKLSVQVGPSPRQGLARVRLTLLAQAGRPTWRVTTIGAILSLSLTLLAGWVAIHLSETYYVAAPYHYDSASYRLGSIRAHDRLISEGLGVSLLNFLTIKDGLDLSLRLVFAPDSLLHPYGHLAVLLPLMGLFIFITIWYVFRRTGSLLLGLAVVAFQFTFPLMYAPHFGIADYWKDNIATWLLGSAAISWLLSETLTRRRWSTLSGVFLGLLVFQRAVVGIYAAMLFGPLFMWAAYQRLREDGLKPALMRLGAFVTPALVIGGTVAILQGQQLYSYYFVTGYAYTTASGVANFLLNTLFTKLGFAPLGLAGVYLVCLLLIRQWPRQRGELVIGLWWVAGLPLAVMVSASLYHGFFPLWMVLLVVLLAVITPRTLSAGGNRWLALFFLAVALPSALIHYQMAITESQNLVVTRGKEPLLQFYRELITIIAAQPEPRRYGLMFDEIEAPLLNQAFFDRGLRLDEPIIFQSIHDSYYRQKFGPLPPQEIANSQIKTLEQAAGTIAVTYCFPQRILIRSSYLETGQTIAAEVAGMITTHLLHSPHWQATYQLNPPYGCLYVYQYTPATLTDEEKWQSVSETPSATEILPGVRMVDYISRYPLEDIDGVHYQWLPSGPNALTVVLSSEQACPVVFEASVTPGPARQDQIRTLIIESGEQKITTPIEGQEHIQESLELQPGLNALDLYVAEPADRSLQPKNGDTRELMLLLTEPRLLPGSGQVCKK